MGENQQDEAGSKPIATENKLWLPPLSPKDQQKHDRLKSRKKAKQYLIVVGTRTIYVMGVITAIYTLILAWQWGWDMLQSEGSILYLSVPILVGILLLILLIQLGSTIRWTGFSGKTLWNWIELLFQIIAAVAIPASIIVGILQFNEQQRNTTAQALDQQQQTTLESYLDHMSDLLLNNKLLDSNVGDEVRSVARARTLTALQNLNSTRKGILLQFLYESRLIQNPQPTDKVKNPIIDLNNADLSNIDLRLANLSGADLHGANLNDAILNGDDLRGANLSDTAMLAADLSPDYPGGPLIAYTDLTNADLTNAFLRAADLSDAILSGGNLHKGILSFSTLSSADLSRADLSGASLNGADLSEANLNDANLSGAFLFNADLSGNASFTKATLHNADLHNVDLSGAKVTTEQLAVVKSLKGATMPNGSRHP